MFGPQGRSRNYFIQSTQRAARDQALIHGYAPQFHLWGTHQIQAGLDADLLHYDGDFSRTGYELAGLSGQILSETTFIGSGLFHVHDAEAAPWLLDTWRIAKRFQIDAGVRSDWDQLVKNKRLVSASLILLGAVCLRPHSYRRRLRCHARCGNLGSFRNGS